MKIAISGKGGVGKTTIAAILSKIFSDKGYKVFAIDADPDSNLATTLGFSSAPTPLIQMKELIEERTGAKIGSRSPFFKLNPKVDDIPDRFFLKEGNISLALMGTVRGGGLGCTCPENAFLKALLRYLILEREDVVIMDMEAGIEHLGRGTTEGIDVLIVVVEPSLKSIETVHRIVRLSSQIGINKIKLIANKTRNVAKEKTKLREKLSDFDFIGFLPYNNSFYEADFSTAPVWEKVPEFLKEGRIIVDKLIQEVKNER
jgi:CO dehydrogenase maturation factor